jgi:hypothetical protein
VKQQDRTSRFRKDQGTRRVGKLETKSHGKHLKESSSSTTGSYTSEAQLSYSLGIEGEQCNIRDLRTFLTGRPFDSITLKGENDICIPSCQTETLFRALQILTPKHEEKEPCQEMLNSGLIETILDTDPDIAVLHVYHWYDSPLGDQEVQLQLKTQGYTLFSSSVFAPVAIATRLPVARREELSLDLERNALFLQIELKNDEKVWICAVNLCEYDEDAKSSDVDLISGWLESNTTKGDRILLTGTCFDSERRDHMTQTTSTDILDDISQNDDAGWLFSRNLKNIGAWESEVEWSYLHLTISDWL